MDEIYHSLQAALVGEVNLGLAAERVGLSRQLRQTFPADEMVRYLSDFIDSEPIDSERQKHQKQLDSTQAIQDADKKHLQLLANLLISLKDRADLKRAIRDKTL